jgi:hypothetical protein
MSTARTVERRPAVKLSFSDGQVMVTAKDQDIFFISASKAIQACRDKINTDERVARFSEEFLAPLGAWCVEHKESISACYLPQPESAVLTVYVIGATEVYDFGLTDELSKLSFWFERKGWAVHLSQIPRCDLEQLSGYFNLDLALQVYG